MFKDLILMATYNLSQRRLRTFLTILGVIIGVAAIVGVVSSGESMEENIYRQLSKIGGDVITVIPERIERGRMPLVGAVKLTTSDLKEVSKVDGVEEVYALIRTNAKVRYGREEVYLSVNGIENSEAWRKVEVERVGLETGRFFSEGEKYSAVIGNSVAHEIFSKDVEERKRIEINGVEFKVVGILNEVGGVLATLDRSVYIPIETARELFSNQFGEDEYTIISAKVPRAYDVDVVAEKINENLLKLHKQTEDTKTFTVISPKFFEETVENVMNTLTIFLGGIAAISLIVGGIGIANIMYVSVIERTREIGVMKAIGATNSTILLLFLLESGTIGLLGGVLGSMLGVTLSYGLNFAVAKSFMVGRNLSTTVIIKPEIILLGCLFGGVVGLLAGYLPARSAAKLEPVEALRYE